MHTARTCPPSEGPTLLCSGFWQQLRQLGEAVDGQSVNWMNALQAGLPVDQDYIQLARTEDDGNQNGVAVYDPPSTVAFTTVYCQQGSCDGFPRSHQYQVRADPTVYLPGTSVDLPLVILVHADQNTSTFVWLHQACPPHYTGNAWCAANSDPSKWKATAMSTQLWNSTGLDRCYPLKHPDLYSLVDLSNSGHRGLPSSYTAIKYWEVAPPAPGIAHRLELSVPVGAVSGAGYFPLAGRESQLSRVGP